MKVLVACEYSRIVSSAFEEKGHDVTSCDLLPAEKPGKHYQGDVRDILYDPWDMIIAHPYCTYNANSGVRWLDVVNGQPTNVARLLKMKEGAKFFRLFLDHPCKKVAVENPIIHKYAAELIGRQDQIIQPWQFGHGETKAICLWLKGLPPLISTEIVEGREARVHKMAPGPDRQKKRSRFYTGIAAAMANQWG